MFISNCWIWNSGLSCKLLHMHYVPCKMHFYWSNTIFSFYNTQVGKVGFFFHSFLVWLGIFLVGWLFWGIFLVFSINVFSTLSWDICMTIQMMLQISVFKTSCLSSSHLNIPKLYQVNILELKNLSQDGDEIVLLSKGH